MLLYIGNSCLRNTSASHRSEREALAERKLIAVFASSNFRMLQSSLSLQIYIHINPGPDETTFYRLRHQLECKDRILRSRHGHANPPATAFARATSRGGAAGKIPAVQEKSRYLRLSRMSSYRAVAATQTRSLYPVARPRLLLLRKPSIHNTLGSSPVTQCRLGIPSYG